MKWLKIGTEYAEDRPVWRAMAHHVKEQTKVRSKRVGKRYGLLNQQPEPLNMTSLIKMFRFKKPKETEDVHIKRSEESRLSLRCSPVPTWRSSKDAVYIGGTSWNKPSAPYSIVTAPKKGRPTRSCPGSVLFPPSQPTTVQAVQIDAPPAYTATNRCPMPSSSVHEARSQQQQLCDAAVKTSEYGSCEPSPTNVSNYLCSTLPDSDQDNDYVSQLQQYECEVRKLRRRLKEERHRFREQLIATQNECDYLKRVSEKATRALVVAQRNIESQRHKNTSLKSKLRDADVLISSLQCERSEVERRRSEEQEEESQCSWLGAGEALCALSHYESTPHLCQMPDQVRNFRTTTDGDTSEPSLRESTSPIPSTPTQLRWQDENECASGTVSKENCERSTKRVVQRSFSDSEIPLLIAAGNELDTPHRRSSPQLITAHPRRLLAHQMGYEEAAGLGWSDDDLTAVQLIGKQLRRRGDVVRFIPPRRTLRTCTFRKFGQRERTALAEFDYLHELSTDASAIASSPDSTLLYT